MSVLTDIAKFNFEIDVNDTKAFAFRLREKGTRNSPDSSAYNFTVKVRGPDYTQYPDIICDPSHPNADWSKSIIVVEFTPYDVTSVVGTWKADLVMNTLVENKTIVSMVIDVTG